MSKSKRTPSKSKRVVNRHQRSTTGRWSAWLGLGGLVLLGLAVVWVVWGNPPPKAAIEVTGAPRLKVDQDQIDLGEVKLGQTQFVTFQLTNVGDQPLRFTQAPYVQAVEGC